MLAFEVYSSGRLPDGLGALGVELEMATRAELKALTEEAAQELLWKLHVIHATVLEIEADEIKRIKDEK